MADKNNNEILNELFFKKKTYSEKFKDSHAQYAPVKNTKDSKSLFGGNSVDGFIISDPDEVKKRIVGALGMAFGNNTVKSMANQAVKKFPIIVSDDVSPETVVIVKTMMEEQYASYIDLLVSNQIINISDYNSDGTNGNIAIQALNKLDGTDFSKGRIARQAQTGSLTLDDVMKNNPGWNFLRVNENAKYNTGNDILDTLLEGAVIVPSEYADVTASKLYESMNVLTEAVQPLYAVLGAKSADEITDDVVVHSVNQVMGATKQITVNDLSLGRLFVDMGTNKIYRRKLDNTWELVSNPDPIDTNTSQRRLRDALDNISNNNQINDYKQYGIRRVCDNNNNVLKTEYDKLISPNIAINEPEFNRLLDQSAARILSGEDRISIMLRDKFEKATFLLSANRISGAEYISYLTERLGIPVSQKVRADLVVKYKATDVTFRGLDGKLDKEDRDYVKELRQCVAHNKKYVLNNVVPRIAKISGKDIIHVTMGAAGGAGAVAGIAALTAAPILWPALAAGAVAGGVGTALAKILAKHKAKPVTVDTNLIGWERVEKLIDDMDKTKIDLLQKSSEQYNFAKEQDQLLNDFIKDMKKSLVSNNVLAEDFEIKDLRPYQIQYSDDKFARAMYDLALLEEEIYNDADLYNEIVINEAAKYIINTQKPGDVIVKQTKYSAKDVANIIPSFGTKDTVAYGSVEYDRRDIKDRKFNEPLILTIKFKERYSDDKYSDNELTAVIGILGVVTRVPSNEMVEILRANAEGKTLNDFFKGEEGNNAKDLIGNLIANFSKSKYAEKLPTSGKVWANLERVSALAVANKLSGTNHGNISNAHLVFSQREIDTIKNELGVDYLKNAKLTAQLMKKYSAFMIAVCNDVMQYLYTFSDPDAISWDDAPYSAYMGKSNSDQLLSAFTQYNRMKL